MTEQYICLKHSKTFSDYEYQSVSWSGDKLPVCPICKQSPYKSSFGEFHAQYRDEKAQEAE